MHATSTFPSVDLTRLLSDQVFGHIIDGKVEAPADQPTYPVIDPSTGKRIVELPQASSVDVDRAVRVARIALPDWRRRTPADRAAALLSLAAIVDEHAELLAQLESLNVGKPLAMSRKEMPLISDVLRFMAGAVRSAQAPAAGEYIEGQVSVVRREPMGVVGAITPWNYPLMTAMWKIAPALGAGNTMVLKPSELTPLTTVVFAELAQGILPPGVLNVVCGLGAEAGKALADHPDVDVISLTGSVASGVAVARAGADTLKHVHLELGGKAPVVVFEDADLDAVVEAVSTMGFWNAGQECGAATRVICAAGVKDDLVARLRAAVASLRVGKPDEGEGIDVGPLISAAHRQRVDDLVQQAVSAGATVELGASPNGDAGFFYPPTLLSSVPEQAAIFRTEVFGPVVTVESFDDEAEAVRLANESDYGLSASVWTESGRRGLRVSDALEYGTVWINTHLVVTHEMPWSGYGMSGLGRELSSYGLDDYTRTKHVMMTK